jgi:hypothetical protein
MLFSRFDTQVSSSLPRNISVRGLRKPSLITAFFLAIRPTLQQGFFSKRKDNKYLPTNVLDPNDLSSKTGLNHSEFEPGFGYNKK